MQLIQIDPLQAQSLQTAVHSLFEMLGPSIRHPLGWAWSSQAAFGRNHQAFGIRIKRFRDQQFACFRTVGICCVNQVHTQLNRVSQNLKRVPAVGRPAPDPFASDAHRAETESIDRKISAQLPGGIRSDV